VRVVPIGSQPKQHVWLVAETMAVGAPKAVIAPKSVHKERNVP
jgi:hypothetical protein